MQPPGEGGAVKVEAGLVLSAGESHQEIAASLKEILALVSEHGHTFTSETIADVEWQTVSMPHGAPPVHFGWKDDYFIIAVGEATPAKIVERMTGAAPKWLAQVRDEHPIDREMSVAYVNVAGILERVKPVVSANSPEAWPIIEKLGLTDIQQIHAVTGFDETGCASFAHGVTEGGRRGLLAFLPYKPLEPGDLRVVPNDALLAMAARIDASEALANGLDLAQQLEPRAGTSLKKPCGKSNRTSA